MPAKPTRAKMMLLGLSVGLLPCIAAAVDMPASPLSEQVDTTHLGEVQEGVTARTDAGWTIQIGAYADSDKADAALARLAQDRPAALGHAFRMVTPVQWDDSHTLYRARFAGLTLETASALCASLNGHGQACFLAKADRSETGVAQSVKPVLREAALVPVTDDMRGAGLPMEAPAMLDAPALALHELLAAVPQLTATREQPSKSMAPKLVALNDKLADDQDGRVSNAELSGMRGGFFTAGGAKFDFGASITTMVNGQLALQTNLTWTPQGPNITSLAGLGQQITDQVDASLAKAGIGGGSSGGASALAASPSSTPSNLNNLTNAASNAASNPTAAASTVGAPAASLATGAVTSALNSAANAVSNGAAAANTAPTATASAAKTQTTLTIPTITGVTIPGANGGSTQILNNIGANQIQSILLNSASGQTISTNTNVMLTIYNLPQLQQQLAQHALSSQLVGEIMGASGLGH